MPDAPNAAVTPVDGSGDTAQAAVSGSADWLDEASQAPEAIDVDEYDIVSAPNDWNVSTIVNFIESGAVKIPAFQRNFVWDIKRASKLIESLLLGLPVPQVFLYEEARNSFLVIDGQQRLLSLFFFAKQRFPKTGSRGALRALLNDGSAMNPSILNNDDLFEDFKLRLAKSPTGADNRFNGKSYPGLGDYKTTLDLRTIRNVVVKQTRPSGNSSIFEIFSRLNTGGVNLGQQEIRASLYHSELMSKVVDFNSDAAWRNLLGVAEPDARMRDTEIILRSLALGRRLDQYSGSMTGFVNLFCLEAQKFTTAQADDAIDDFSAFVRLLADISPESFKRQGKFSGVLFESVFAAWVAVGRPKDPGSLTSAAIAAVRDSPAFARTLQEGSTKTANVRGRVELAERHLAPGQ